jgi:DNA-binding beta-propeller fold protein YncE
MKNTLSRSVVIAIAGVVAVACIDQILRAQTEKTITAHRVASSSGVPTFQVDAAWPKPLPNNWQIGDVAAVSVDSRDHIWIAHRPKTLDAQEAAAAQTPPAAECCLPAPPVIEFDQEGNVVQAWGGPNPAYEWPETEHGLTVDDKDNVWITAAETATAAQILKFTRDGKFLLQIGHKGKSTGNADTENMNQPSMVQVDSAANEVFVADGHKNRRVIVFDASTGAFKRYWGAYGEKPDDSAPAKGDPKGPPPRQFSSAASVHCIHMTKDGLLYVCDRANDRFQIFRKDGTFVQEVLIAPGTLGLGTAADLGFSPDQRFVYVADTFNAKVWILSRDKHQIVGSFGRQGRWAGQFHYLHDMAVDSKGNIYTGEASGSKRVQKFTYKGSS